MTDEEHSQCIRQAASVFVSAMRAARKAGLIVDVRENFLECDATAFADAVPINDRPIKLTRRL